MEKITELTIIFYLFIFYLTKVSCNCPCKFGDSNGLSNTNEYKTQCFENEVFQWMDVNPKRRMDAH